MVCKRLNRPSFHGAKKPCDSGRAPIVTERSNRGAAQRMAPVHPGEILQHDFLLAKGVTQSALANALDVSQSAVAMIVSGTRPVTTEMAVRLSICLGTSAEFWINLQAHYDLEVELANVDAYRHRIMRLYQLTSL